MFKNVQASKRNVFEGCVHGKREILPKLIYISARIDIHVVTHSVNELFVCIRLG